MERLSIHRFRDLIWLMKANLVTIDQICMIISGKAYKSEQQSYQWHCKCVGGFKLGEY